MADAPRAHWIHFDDAPEGTLEAETFRHFRKPLADAGAKSLDMTLVEMAPGEAGPLHAHHGTVEEFYVVLAGEPKVKLADEVVETRQGTTFFFPPGTAHGPLNDTDEDARILTLRTGEGDRTVIEE